MKVNSSQVTTIPNPPFSLPPIYLAYKVTEPFDIDGNIDKPIWDLAEWSSEFEDIRGNINAPKDYIPSYHGARTRVKILWDEENLYIAAMLEYLTLEPECDDDEKIVTDILASYTERNSPIYHEDSDFEVFIDADSSSHFYKELEMNAINTVWNLMLDKPYMDGGSEHSARVTTDPNDPLYYEVFRQKTAAKLVKGQINGESAVDKTPNIWTVEVALPHRESTKFNLPSRRRAPKVGDFWKINFSRVENQGDINWTWAPQFDWDPVTKSFNGIVNMHAPECWGYVFFLDEKTKPNVQSMEKAPLSWNLLVHAMSYYYALHYFKSVNGVFTDDLSLLSLPRKDLFVGHQLHVVVEDAGSAFVINALDLESNVSIQVSHDRKVSYFANDIV